MLEEKCSPRRGRDQLHNRRRIAAPHHTRCGLSPKRNATTLYRQYFLN